MIRELYVAAAIAGVGIGATPPAGAEPLADLIGMLPPGYTEGSCCHADAEPLGDPGALATVSHG